MKLKIWIDEGRKKHIFRRTLYKIKRGLRWIYLKTPYRQIPTKIIHSHKAIYFDIPKVATSSIFNLIYKEVNKEENSNYYDMYKMFPQVREIDTNKKWFNDYYKFAFVRNPYSRIVSCYTSIMENTKEDTVLRGLGIYNIPSFKEFVIAVSKKTDKELSNLDPHTTPQHLYLYKNNELLVDHVGKLENLNEEMNIIFKKIGFGQVEEIPRLNKTSIGDWRDYYNDEIRDIVFERYKKDFELFDYKGDVI